MITPYIRLARIDNWTKNLLIFAGVGLASALSQFTQKINFFNLVLCFVAVCLASSANYVLNESIDSKSDNYHPIKKNRAAVSYQLNKLVISLEYFLFMLSSLLIGWIVHKNIFLILCVYIVAAWFYNIPPLRLKDKAYADVLFESMNYPIRIFLGWLCVLPTTELPSSIIITSWAIGAFAMSMKRLAEFQLFENQAKAALYRKSYASYTVHTLMLSSFLYSMTTIFGMTVIMLKYKTEMILLIPLFIMWMGWYFNMGLKQKLEIIYPERLTQNKIFLGLAFLTLMLFFLLLKINIPFIHNLDKPLDFTTGQVGE